MTAPAPDSVLQLLDHMHEVSAARARQIAGWIDVYLHTMPPPQRAPELLKMLKIWAMHQSHWERRIDAATALPTELALSSFDWSETDAALRTLLRDLEQADA